MRARAALVETAYGRAVLRPARHGPEAEHLLQRELTVDNIPLGKPHQLRHTAATRLRKQFGIEAARVILGHRSSAVTEIYAEVDRSRAVEVLEAVG